VRGTASAPNLRLAAGAAAVEEAIASPFVARRESRRLRFKRATGLARRVLIFGSGEKALTARKELLDSESAVQVVGFYASTRDGAIRAAGTPVIPAGTMTLLEAARKVQADEIVVAVGDRRGGVLPLLELLDCKLSGIRVYDLSSHFEHHLGLISLDS